ncbi:hypothetical protein JCM33374_g120 [Metschnikowia sp. JCM 33374]|nr:hypothetical protein JCM33374_g120 [Metschnikowia sp. JCM 33374]
MSASASRLQEQNETAQLAAHFNEFYLQTTSPGISEIGNYRILQEIGEGAFGKVYLAEHVLLHSQVVLKCGLLADPNIVREIYYHKQLRHRNIVKLYEVIKTETQLWMVLEYCEGSELYYHIYEQRHLDVTSSKNLFYQIVEAIRYVHSLNLSHRDLKLENILMADKEKTVVKLTDFGFVREFNPYKRTFLSTVCGTTSYMAPEVLKNEKYSGFAIDVWSMGVILYAMVYGQLPFDEDDDMKTKFKIINAEPKYREAIPLEINQLLEKMLSKDPTQRPSISEILNSPFLIDVTNEKSHRRNSTMTDTDSFISINQYYNVHSIPFQSRMEKDLLKKLRKGNIDIETLISSKINGQVNSLTAFYDLSLKSEFEKQKRRHLRRKRYYEAKRQLKRSKRRVKSVLSLSDQLPDGPPLEKILSSLSIASNKNDNSPSASNMTRMSSENTTRNSVQPQRRISYSKSASGNGSSDFLRGNAVSTPLKRSVSFYTDDRKSSNISYRSDLGPKPKSKQILEKLQFWKKIKQRDGEVGVIDVSSSHSRTLSDQDSIKSDNGVLEINVSRSPRKIEADNTQLPLDNHSKIDISSQNNLDKVETIIEESKVTSEPSVRRRVSKGLDTIPKRPRPESVISQFSQYSQVSQLYTMSESELDMMDGTDLEDDFYDDDGAYDSSISVSQNDLLHRPTSLTSSSRGKRRPPNFRIPSDTSILSSSTNATRRKNPLSRVSSNSSDESAAAFKLSERPEDSSNGSVLFTRPTSPRQELIRNPSGKSRNSRSSSLTKHSAVNGSMVTPSPIFPQSSEGIITRSVSPPFGNKGPHRGNGIGTSPISKFRVNGVNTDISGSNGRSAAQLPKSLLKMPATDSHTWRRDSPIASPATNVFERKFISINEEEEDEEDVIAE